MSEQLALFIDFENIAIWAEKGSIEIDLTRLITFLENRGRIVLKRAYADWCNFPDYRDGLFDNAIDLIQIYSTRSGKNRSDIQLCVDALQTVFTHQQIDTIVIVSGDSDFGPLVSKLQEYGRFVLGIGPRDITHDILLKVCDEFIFLEEVLEIFKMKEARNLLQRSLTEHGNRGEIPVMASRLKHTMASKEPSFNETRLGYRQFKEFLVACKDIAKIMLKDQDLYVAPAGYVEPPQTREKTEEQPVEPGLNTLYRQLFQKTVGLDLQDRRDVLRTIYKELRQHPLSWTGDKLLDELVKRYRNRGMDISKYLLLKIWQMAYKQRAFNYDGNPSFETPVALAVNVDTERMFFRRAESHFIYSVILSGYPINLPELASIFYNSREKTRDIQGLIDDLLQRNFIVKTAKGYLPVENQEQTPEDIEVEGEEKEPETPSSANPADSTPILETGLPDNQVADIDLSYLENIPALNPLIKDILTYQLSPLSPIDHLIAQESYEKGLEIRRNDFSAAAPLFLQACRLEWELIKNKNSTGNLESLFTYMAFYTSTKAGDSFKKKHDYALARLYYLAFFGIVENDHPFWQQKAALINTQLYYYFLSIGKELGIQFKQSLSLENLVVQIARHPNAKCHQMWHESTYRLAQANASLLEYLMELIQKGKPGDMDCNLVVSQIDLILKSHMQGIEPPVSEWAPQFIEEKSPVVPLSLQEPESTTNEVHTDLVAEEQKTPSIASTPLEVPPQFQTLQSEVNEFRQNSHIEVIFNDIQMARVDSSFLTYANKIDQLIAQGERLYFAPDPEAAADTFLSAACLLWDTYRRSGDRNVKNDLKVCMALYAVSQADSLSLHRKDYSLAKLYYFAFFSLAQEADPIWEKLDTWVNIGLRNYWALAYLENGEQPPDENSAIEFLRISLKSSASGIQLKLKSLTQELIPINKNLVQKTISHLSSK